LLALGYQKMRVITASQEEPTQENKAYLTKRLSSRKTIRVGEYTKVLLNKSKVSLRNPNGSKDSNWPPLLLLLLLFGCLAGWLAACSSAVVLILLRLGGCMLIRMHRWQRRRMVLGRLRRRRLHGPLSSFPRSQMAQNWQCTSAPPRAREGSV
jgi:hypothetical protein